MKPYSADDITRMHWVLPTITKNKVAEALQDVDSRCSAFPQSLGVKIETNPPDVPQSNARAERGFGTIIGMTRGLLREVPQLPHKRLGEAATMVVYLCKRTTSTTLSEKAPSELLYDTSLRSPEHVHEWGCATYKPVETRQTSAKLEREALMCLLAGPSARNCSWRLWDPTGPVSTAMSAEVSFRDGSCRGVERRHEERPSSPAMVDHVYLDGRQTEKSGH